MRKALFLALVLGACAGGPGVDAVSGTGATGPSTAESTTTRPVATTTTSVAVTTTTIDAQAAAIEGCEELANSIDKDRGLDLQEEELGVAEAVWDEVLRQMRFLCPVSVGEALGETPPALPVDAAGLRAEFIADLDGAGWPTYQDPVIGWSIRYPPDWATTEEEPGANVSLQTPDGALFMISAAQDALDDEGSRDYLALNVEYYLGEGLIREPDDEGWFWLDHDFDGERGLLDIEGVETSWAFDFSTGEQLPDEVLSPTWRYAYYDPAARPAYSYIMQTVGFDPELFANADRIALSFRPPDSPAEGALLAPPDPSSSLVSVFSIEVGDCFDDPDAWGTIEFLPVIDCAQPHDNEVYAAYDLADGDAYPGDDEVDVRARRGCEDRFEAFVGIDYLESDLYATWLSPTESGWDAGDRTVICVVYEGDLSKLVGSVRGVGR